MLGLRTLPFNVYPDLISSMIVPSSFSEGIFSAASCNEGSNLLPAPSILITPSFARSPWNRFKTMLIPSTSAGLLSPSRAFSNPSSSSSTTTNKSESNPFPVLQWLGYAFLIGGSVNPYFQPENQLTEQRSNK